jgi:CheY-like chemotaxis protein
MPIDITPSQRPPGPFRVLIVDDDSALRTLLVRVIGGAGFLVTWASNGEAALESVRTDPPDVVLLDMQLPGMSGGQVAALLPRHMRVIIISGSMSPEEVRAEGMRVSHALTGALLILSKPIDVHQLLSTLHRIEGSVRATEPAPMSDPDEDLEVTAPAKPTPGSGEHTFDLTKDSEPPPRGGNDGAA